MVVIYHNIKIQYYYNGTLSYQQIMNYLHSYIILLLTLLVEVCYVINLVGNINILLVVVINNLMDMLILGQMRHLLLLEFCYHCI
jgi:hypothetical protein